MANAMAMQNDPMLFANSQAAMNSLQGTNKRKSNEISQDQDDDDDDEEDDEDDDEEEEEEDESEEEDDE